MLRENEDSLTIRHDGEVVKIFSELEKLKNTIKGYQLLSLPKPDILGVGACGASFIRFREIKPKDVRGKIGRSAALLRRLHQSLPGPITTFRICYKNKKGDEALVSRYREVVFEALKLGFDTVELDGNLARFENVELFPSDKEVHGTLIHGNFHLDNIIFSDEDYIIDFDGIRVGDPYYDLASAFDMICKRDMEIFKRFLSSYDYGFKLDQIRLSENLVMLR